MNRGKEVVLALCCACIVLTCALPRFRQAPSNKTVEKTECAVLRCSASSPDTKITWLKDGKVLTGDNYVVFRSGLLIVSAHRKDRGWYVCNATNRAGTKLARAYLQVLRPPDAALPRFRHVPSNKTVNVTESALLRCSALSSDTKITWLKDGKVLTGDNYTFLRSGLLIVTADRKDRGWLVCNATNRAGTKLARAYLKVVRPLDADCGKPTLTSRGRIVGETKVKAGHYPWQVSLWNTRDNKHFCGGSLVSERWIVTAASCVTTGALSLVDMEVRLGKLFTNREERGREQIIRPDRIITHSQYNRIRVDYNFDIALIRLKSKAILTDYVRPICLPLRGEDGDGTLLRPGRIGVITGWGRKHETFGRDIRKRMREVSLPIVDQVLCKAAYSPRYVITDSMFCAGYYNGTLGDACQGDTGGPLAIDNSRTKSNDNQRWVLAGIISWGVGCRRIGKYGVYTRMSMFAHWVNDQIDADD